MTEKEQMEQLLTEYGVAFTSSLADRLLELLHTAYEQGYEQGYDAGKEIGGDYND